MNGGIEGSVLEAESVTGAFANVLGDRVAMQRPGTGKGSQDEEIERFPGAGHWAI